MAGVPNQRRKGGRSWPLITLVRDPKMCDQVFLVGRKVSERWSLKVATNSRKMERHPALKWYTLPLDLWHFLIFKSKLDFRKKCSNQVWNSHYNIPPPTFVFFTPLVLEPFGFHICQAAIWEIIFPDNHRKALLPITPTLQYSALHYSALHWIILHKIQLHSPSSTSTALHWNELFCTRL